MFKVSNENTRTMSLEFFFWKKSSVKKKAFKVMESHPHSYSEDFEIHPRYSTVSFSRKWNWTNLSSTAWKVSKYGDLSGPYFPAFALNTEMYSEIPYSVRMRENADQKKLRIWTLFMQWSLEAKYKISLAIYHMIEEGDRKGLPK